MMLLVQFYHEQPWIEFRAAEFNALMRLHGIKDIDITTSESMLLVLNADIPIETLRSICARSVLVKAIYELYASADNLNQLVQSSLTSTFGRTIAPLSLESWALNIESLNRSMTPELKEVCRMQFRGLGMQGPVNLKTPFIDLWIILEFDRLTEEGLQETLPLAPCWLGRVLARGGMREDIKRYDLKSRNYVGPTSLDHSLALIMANITGITPGQLVYDPFVGTASLLVAASHFGARCTGADIDIRVLKGDMYAGHEQHGNKRRDIQATFDSYHLPRPELVRLDNSLVERHLECSIVSNLYDVILTDPPYGIRAGARKSGRKDHTITIQPERRDEHFPATQQYAMEEVMLDLLHTAAMILKPGGLLAYLIPTPYGITDEDLPKHPCLQMEVRCLQSLSTRHGRQLVVLRKVAEYTADLRQAFVVYKQSIREGNDGGFGQLLVKLQAALSNEAHENEAVVKQISQRCAKRKANKLKNRLNYVQQSSKQQEQQEQETEEGGRDFQEPGTC